jgi:hypothetical protein
VKHSLPALVAVSLAAQVPAALSPAQLDREIRGASLDPEACFRVRDLSFQKEDIRVFFTDGYLIFARPVAGRRLAAVFRAETEGGDGEVLLLPPSRSERQSLASFTNSPALDEHISGALLISTDGTADQLYEQLANGGSRSLEMGALLAAQWTPVVRNIEAGFEVRILEDLLDPQNGGLFFLAASGKTLGNFDLIHDPYAREQIVAGQLTERNDRLVYDIWTSFESRSVRRNRKPPPPDPVRVRQYTIEADLRPDLTLAAVTRLSFEIGGSPIRALSFELSRRMNVTEAKLNGERVEIFARESPRAGALRGDDNDTFVVAAPAALAPGSRHELEFRHEGKVIAQAGNDVLFVGARATWYPRRGLNFAVHDVTFRHPRQFRLAMPGQVREDRVEGEVRVTRRVTENPVRLFGFNLGNYERAAAGKVEVFGNRRTETALTPRPVVVMAPVPGMPARRPQEILLPAPPVDPTARLRTIAADIGGAFDFMTQQFGPAALPSLTVSPIPGAFGQGFPGLVYLSTIAYLDPAQRPAGYRSSHQQLFFSELIEAHETAHQWFGNVVTAAGYQDEWLMEALANYAGLLFLEKRKGPRVVSDVLADYRDRLLAEKDGQTLESAGPITWGVRLTSLAPEAWRAITYEKGSWILHMLRSRMGDVNFRKMLFELCRRHRQKPISTDQFRELCVEFLPPKTADPKLTGFFETWVYGTGIPELRVTHAVAPQGAGFRVSGAVTQAKVPEDFGVDVPVEIQFAKGAPVVQWVKSASDGTRFAVNVPQRPLRVAIGAGVLARK